MAHHDHGAGCGDHELEMPWNDPTLASCCARDLKNFHKAMKLKDFLTEHDPTTQNVRMRQQIIQPPPPSSSSSSSLGCSRHCKDECCGCAMSHMSLATTSKNDDEDDEYDYLLDEEEDEALDTETMRLMAMRRQQLQQQAQEALENARDGFGVVNDSASCREFVDQLQKENTASIPQVVYFYDHELAGRNAPRGQSSDVTQSILAIARKQLAVFAQNFTGTRFVMVPFNLRRNQDRDYMHSWRINQLPVLAAFRDGECRNLYVFDASKTSAHQQDALWEGMVMPWLENCHVLERTRRDTKGSSANYDQPGHNATHEQAQEEEEEEEEHEFDCGIVGCRIRFAYEHEHIGTSNETKQQISSWRRHPQDL